MDSGCANKDVSNNMPQQDLSMELEEREFQSVSFYADELKFTCVWRQPTEELQMINQIMNNLNINDENEFGDQTPSNILDLLSSSFPGIDDAQTESFEPDVSNAENVESIVSSFEASTPNAKRTSKSSSAKEKLEFDDTSPILFSPRHSRSSLRSTGKLSRRKLDTSQEFEEGNFDIVQKLSDMNI